MSAEMLSEAELAFERALEDDDYWPFSSNTTGPEALDDDDLSMLLASEIRQSVNEETSLIARQQEEADKYYRGDEFGNEVEGRSSVVTHDLAETIDWMMPVLMRMFFYTQRVVRYGDVSPEAEARGVAAEATRTVNPLFREKLRGFEVTHDWIKSALLYKVGILKCWVEKLREPKFDWLSLSKEELFALIEDEDPDTEIVSISEESSQEMRPIPMPPPPPPQPGQPPQPPPEPEMEAVEVWQVRVKQWQQIQKIRLESVAPEEFLIARRARRLDDDTPFSCHKRPVTKGELAAMGIGWDVLEDLPTHDMDDYDGRKETREEDEITTYGDTMYRPDIASHEVMVWESYVRVDYDGDGYAELRKVLAAGNEASPTVLMHEIVDCNPLISIIPKPMPHKFYGRSVHDDIEDLQRIRSTLLRGMLDNIYLQNAPRMWALEGEVDMDRLLEAVAGGIIPVSQLDGGKPPLGAIETTPLSNWVIQALELTQQMREDRTGVSRISSSTLADSQNQTALGVAQVFEAAEARICLVAQLIAESGMRQLFRKMPRILKGSGLRPMMVKAGEEWLPFDPATWPDDMDCTIEVGLSPGQTEQRIQRLLMILGLQKESMAALGPFITNWQKIYNVVAKITEEAGFANPEIAWNDPKGQTPPPQPPPPEAIEAQAKMVTEQMKVRLSGAKVEQKAQYDKRTLDIRQMEVQLSHERELARIAMEERVRTQETLVQAQIDRERMEMEMARAELQAQTAEKTAEAKSDAGDGAQEGASDG